MNRDTPQDLLAELVRSRSRGDVDAALACYEPHATIVTQPGQPLTGTPAVRGVLEYFAASRASFTVLDRVFLEADGIALHLSLWSLQGVDPDGAGLRASGRSTDVARRQPDGSWLLAIDNPWGA